MPDNRNRMAGTMNLSREQELTAEIESLKDSMSSLREFHQTDMRVTTESANFHITECGRLRTEIDRLKALNDKMCEAQVLAVQDRDDIGLKLAQLRTRLESLASKWEADYSRLLVDGYCVTAKVRKDDAAELREELAR